METDFWNLCRYRIEGLDAYVATRSIEASLADQCPGSGVLRTISCISLSHGGCVVWPPSGSPECF